MPDDSIGIMPTQTEVLIIGGGIIGAVTALELAERGVPVVVCEKGSIGAEQSGRNLGWCRQLGRDPRELPLTMLALRNWQGLNARVGGETGFRQCGILNLCETEEQVAAQQARVDELGPIAKEIGLKTLSDKEAADAAPGAAQGWAGGAICTTDGKAEPGLAAKVIMRAAERAGAVVLTRCAVRGIEQGGGRVSGVITERGPISCAQVVLAGGVWSRHLCASLGIRLPQLMTTESLLRTTPVSPADRHCLTTGRIAYRPRSDGGLTVAQELASIAEVIPATFRYMFDFLPALKRERARLSLRFGRKFLDEVALPRRWKMDEVSPFESFRTLEVKPSKKKVLEAFAELKQIWPEFEGLSVAQHWAGYVDVTPDALPVMSAIDEVPGLYLATGFSGHGFGISPAIGPIMADMVTGAPDQFDMSAFSYNRFRADASAQA